MLSKLFKLSLILWLLSVSSISPLNAEEDDSIINLSLKELLNIKIKDRSKLKLFYDPKNKPDENSINIGILISFSDKPEFFADFLLAADLAVQDINRKGGIFGKRLVLIRGNSTTDPKLASSITEQMIKRHKVKMIIGPMYSSMVKQVAINAAIPNNTPLVLPSATASYISKLNDNDLIFRLAPTNRQIVQNSIDLMQKHQVKRLGVFYQDDYYGYDLFGLLEELSQANDIKIIYDKKLKTIVDYETYDFVDELITARSLNLDGYFLPIPYEVARWGTIRNIIKREKPPIPLLFLPEYSRITTLNSNSEVCVFGIDVDSNKQQVEQLNLTIESYLGSVTRRHYTPLIHDAVYLSAAALAHQEKYKLPLNQSIRMVAHKNGQSLAHSDFQMLSSTFDKYDKVQFKGIGGSVVFDTLGDNS
ncbi:MAG: ABC transporter substrate-binding protein, partial [Kangiellaceae bacterium]|nr:ABC transporter substrate-binding protein [Kangiellaceae bacterium]